MKAYEKHREFEVWDHETKGTLRIMATDFKVLSGNIMFVNISQSKDAAIRALLEICKVDPDLYDAIGDQGTTDQIRYLKKLVLQAHDNVKGIK